MRLFTTILAAIILLMSCKKITVERNTSPQGYSVAQIIGTWKITAASSDKAYDWNGDGVPEKNIYAAWTDCRKDNLFTFNQGYSSSYKISCNDTKGGSWKLDGITIIMLPDGMATLYENIDTLTSNQIKTIATVQPVPGDYYKISKTWTRQ